MAVMFGRKSLGESPEHLEHHFWKPKNLFGYCFRAFFFFWPKNILWHLHHHLGRDRMRTELYPTAYRAYSWSVFRDPFKIGSGGYWGARNWTQVSCVLDKSPTLCTISLALVLDISKLKAKEISTAELSIQCLVFHIGRHRARSDLFETMHFADKNYIKLCLNVLECSVHSKSKNIIKMHTLELASYILSAVETF